MKERGWEGFEDHACLLCRARLTQWTRAGGAADHRLMQQPLPQIIPATETAAATEAGALEPGGLSDRLPTRPSTAAAALPEGLADSDSQELGWIHADMEPETPPPPLDAVALQLLGITYALHHLLLHHPPHLTRNPETLLQVAAQILDIIASSSVLATMSNVRKLAIQQALMHASSPDKALNIALESLLEAPLQPCMPSGLKDGASELLLTCSWSDLRQALQCPPLRCDHQGQPLLHTPAYSSVMHFQHYRR